MPDDTTRRFDFVKLDYEKILELIHHMQDQKLSYQKFYMSAISAMITIAIIVVRFPPTTQQQGVLKLLGSRVTIEALLGFLFIFGALIGLLVIRNLASIRIGEVRYNRAILKLRSIEIANLKLGSEYPTAEPPRCSDRETADYLSIAACSVINLAILMFGVLLIGCPAPVPLTCLLLVVVVLLYAYAHYVSVEKTLMRADEEQKAK